MASRFDRITTIQQVEELISVTDIYLTLRAFYDGDPWQDGKGWVGPMPDSDAIIDGAKTLTDVEETMVTHNAIREVTERHIDGIASEPLWSFAPVDPVEQGEEVPDEIKRLIKELQAFLTVWWDEQDV